MKVAMQNSKEYLKKNQENTTLPKDHNNLLVTGPKDMDLQFTW